MRFVPLATTASLENNGSPSPLAPGVSLHPVVPGHGAMLNLPRTVDGQTHPAFTDWQRQICPPAYVAEIDDCLLYTHHTSMAYLTSGGHLLEDLSRDYGKSVAGHPVHSARFTRPDRITAPALVLGSKSSQEFFHWFFDVLPRIALAERLGLVERCPVIVLPPLVRPFQIRSLQMLDFPLHKCVQVEPEGLYKLDKAFVPSPPGVSGNIPVWAARYLRDVCAKALPAAPERDLKLYISRAGAGVRRLLGPDNEQQVWDVLQRHGYTRVQAEKLDLSEQAALFARATAVFAPHGAGLVNLLHCAPGTRVVEVFQPAKVHPCYWTLCNGLDLDYACVMGRGVEGSASWDTDILLSENELESALRALA